MKKVAFVLFIILLSMGVSVAQEKEKKVIESAATKVESTRGADPNIEVARSNEDIEEPNPEAARGTYCKVWIDNWTGYKIDIYIDGKYKGTIPAWEKQYAWAVSGKTKLYAKSTGGTYYWGPSWVDCDFEFTWKLNKPE